MEKTMTGGIFLIRLRTKCGFSQQELADRMHTTRTVISRLENDQRIMEKVECSLMAEAYDIPSDVFIKAYRMALEGRNPFAEKEGDKKLKPRFSFEEAGKPIEIAINYPPPSNFIVVRYASVSDQPKERKKLYPLVKSSIVSAVALFIGFLAFISILCGAVLPEMNRAYLAENPGASIPPLTLSFTEFSQLSAFYFITLFCVIAIEAAVYFTLVLIRKYRRNKVKKENLS